MNDRIKALAQESFFDEATNAPSDRMYTFSEAKMQKFADLIVRECINVVEGGSFLHDQAPTAIFARECSVAIKRHFGVEE